MAPQFQQPSGQPSSLYTRDIGTYKGGEFVEIGREMHSQTRIQEIETSVLLKVAITRLGSTLTDQVFRVQHSANRN